MNNGKKLYDTWVESQLELFDEMDLFDTYLVSQERFLTNWIESLKSLHKSIKINQESSEIPGINMYHHFFNTWFDASSALNDEILQKQKLLEATIEKQAEIFREMIENTSDSLK